MQTYALLKKSKAVSELSKILKNIKTPVSGSTDLKQSNWEKIKVLIINLKQQWKQTIVEELKKK